MCRPRATISSSRDKHPSARRRDRLARALAGLRSMPPGRSQRPQRSRPLPAPPTLARAHHAWDARRARKRIHADNHRPHPARRSWTNGSASRLRPSRRRPRARRAPPTFRSEFCDSFSSRLFLAVIPSEVEGPLTLPFSLTLARIRGSSTPLRSARNDKLSSRVVDSI